MPFTGYRSIKARVTTADKIYDRCKVTLNTQGIRIQTQREVVQLNGIIESLSRDSYTLQLGDGSELITIDRQGGCACGGGGRVIDRATMQTVG